MSFSPGELEILRHTLGQLSADPQRASALFYAHLFRLAPHTRQLFVNDIERQGDKLMATIQTIVLQLDHWPTILPMLEDLGLRHVAYGVKAADYEPTGEAIILMVKDIIGNEFTPEIGAAWSKFYALVATAMIEAIERRKSGAGDALARE